MKRHCSTGDARTKARLVCCFGVALFILLSQAAQAQPPSHDPSRMIRNTDGRYWIFTTGDGVWAMSSSNSNFTDWRAERTVFPIGTLAVLDQ